MTHRIALRSKPSPHFGETHKRWQVLLNGEAWGEPFYDYCAGSGACCPCPAASPSTPAR